MSRDPKANPIFGDVFQFEAADMVTVFLCLENDGGWTGLDIFPNGAVRLAPGLKDLPDPDWYFIETIDGHAAGGPMMIDAKVGIDFAADADGTFVTTAAGWRALGLIVGTGL